MTTANDKLLTEISILKAEVVEALGVVEEKLVSTAIITTFCMPYFNSKKMHQCRSIVSDKSTPDGYLEVDYYHSSLT